MDCRQLETRLDDYLDGAIAAEESAALGAHIEGCTRCAARLRRARELEHALRGLPVDGPAPDFFGRALHAACQPKTDRGPRIRSRYFGALAASLAAVAIVVSMIRDPMPEPSGSPAGVAQVAMTVEERRTINLVFASSRELMELRLSVELPAGIELASHPGQREVQWTTELHEGKNVLPLELVAIGGSGGELIATLRHDGSQRIFRVGIDVDMG